ncbi:MAG TPA: hypothetical protein VNI61_05860 [Gemmatimonadales bacterium]|nr:hypothetical protein [Gemmatimonadales bacterium]
MSQFLAYRGFSLRRAAPSTKVLLTAFNAVVALAVAVGIVMYQVRTRLTPAGGAAYYGGTELDPGPSALELLDATHPHLFASSFLLFVLGHLFALTRASQRAKTRLALLGFATVVVDAAAPWVIRFVWPPFALVQVVNTAVMAGVILIYLAVPLYEMWLGSEPQPASQA